MSRKQFQHVKSYRLNAGLTAKLERISSLKRISQSDLVRTLLDESTDSYLEEFFEQHSKK